MFTKKSTREIKSQIDGIFTEKNIIIAWKKTVRNGLRSQVLDDMFDYLDYHHRIEGIARRVRERVISGLYRPKSPHVAKLEKSKGICRRIVMPSPEDALCLQVLVNFLEEKIKEKRPSDSAFYSRSHMIMPSIDKIDGTFSYPWWKLWPEFQKRIWRFSKEREYTVTTDLANYYDTIPLSNLRQQIAFLTGIEGPVLDFMFYILESFVWRPDYIPHPGVGLPQINFDTPRLLAHAYLYPIDAFLEKEVREDFVRWMDDIDFGVDSANEGKRLLRDIDQLLASYGVRLNAGKTRIMDKKEASEWFWVSDNRHLSTVQNVIKNSSSDESAERIRKYVRRSFGRFWEKATNGYFGQWEKVLKRYIGIMGSLNMPDLDGQLADWIGPYPSLRPSIFRYLLALGYSKERGCLLKQYLFEECIDWSSFFAAVRVLVGWRNLASEWAIGMVKCLLENKYIERSGIYSSVLWIVAKYGSADDVIKYLYEGESIWTQDSWCSRQVSAVAPRLDAEGQKLLREKLLREAQFEGVKILDYYERSREKERLSSQLKSYLVPENQQREYPLGKVMLVISLLSGKLQEEQRRLLTEGVVSLAGDSAITSLLNDAYLRSVS